MNKSVHQVGN